MDIRQHAIAIRETSESLPAGDLYVISLKNHDKGTTAGCTVMVTRASAARGIVEQTHRVATLEEIDAHLADQKAKGDAIRQADMESRFPLNLNVYPVQPGNTPKAERTR